MISFRRVVSQSSTVRVVNASTWSRRGKSCAVAASVAAYADNSTISTNNQKELNARTLSNEHGKCVGINRRKSDLIVEETGLLNRSSVMTRS